MWAWIIAIAAVALLVFVLISVLPQHPRRRTRSHDFERYTDTEHLYKL